MIALALLNLLFAFGALILAFCPNQRRKQLLTIADWAERFGVVEAYANENGTLTCYFDPHGERLRKWLPPDHTFKVGSP